MTVSPIPIGRLIVLASNQKDLFSKLSLEYKINNLVDLIKIRIADQSLDEVANGLLPELFDLRFDLLEYFAINGLKFNDYIGAIDKHITNSLNVKTYSDLSKTITFALEWYSIIISPIFHKKGIEDFSQLLESFKENKPNYDSLKLLSLHPLPQTKLIKNWIDASLAFETGLIIADLILTEKLKISKSRIRNELDKFINDSLTRFGGYSIFTGFWKPNITDNSHVLNKMRIFNSTLELENGIQNKLSEGDFLGLINN